MIHEMGASTAQFSPERVAAYDRALVYVGLGQKETAMAWLERAYRERNRSLQFSRVEPRLDPMRNHPPFQNLLKRLNL